MIHSICMGNKIYGLVFAFAFHFKSFKTQFKNKSSPFSSLPPGDRLPRCLSGSRGAVTFCFTIWHHAALQIF